MDAGDNSALGLVGTDLGGNERVAHCRVDLGVYESPYFVDCNDNGVGDACDIDEGTSLDENGNGVPDECEAPMICRSPEELTVECSPGQDAESQDFEVWNSGPAGTILDYTLSVDEDWLGIDPPPGGISDGTHNVHTVSYSTADLLEGTYYATITISDPNASNNPQTIPVTLTVNAPPPSICYEPESLVNECSLGDGASSQTFDVWNCGDEGSTLDYTFTVDYTPPASDWILSIAPPSGTLGSEDDPITHTVSYSTAGLNPGDYSATITIEDPEADNNPQVIDVELSVLGCYRIGGAIYDEWTEPHLHGVADVTVLVEGDGGTFVFCTDDSGAGIWGTEVPDCVPAGTYTITPVLEGCVFYEVVDGSQGDPVPITIVLDQDLGSIKFFAECEAGACCLSGGYCLPNVDHDTCAGIPDAVYQGNGSTCEDPCQYEDCNANGRLDSVDVGTCGSDDCQPNGIPDECDIDPSDPDGNGQVSPDDNGNGIPDECEWVLGDLDGDEDVDLDDYALFAACLTGPDSGIDPGCELADLDVDTDVDLADFAIFQAALAGGSG